MSKSQDRVSLGGLLNALIAAGVMAGSASTLGVAVLAYRADASDEKVASIDNRQRAIEKIQAVLMREVEWTSSKLDALLAAKGVAVPPPPPLRKIPE